jgi:hypothetical protein
MRATHYSQVDCYSQVLHPRLSHIQLFLALRVDQVHHDVRANPVAGASTRFFVRRSSSAVAIAVR